MFKNVEAKVVWASAGGGAGGVLGTFIIWLLGAWLWKGGWSAADSANAVAQVPGPVAALIPLVIAGLGSFVGGYVAPHTVRTDIQGDK